MATASLVALVASLAMTTPAAAGALQPIDTWQAVSEINCEVHGQGFYTAVPRAPAKERRPVSAAADVPVWKTIGIGTYDSSRALREALRRKRCRVGEQAQAALDRLAPWVAKRPGCRSS